MLRLKTFLHRHNDTTKTIHIWDNFNANLFLDMNVLKSNITMGTDRSVQIQMT